MSDTTTVLVLGGGTVYGSSDEYVEALRARVVDLERFVPRKDWKQELGNTLGGRYRVLCPHMPLRDNAPYALWKLWFEKIMVAVPEAPLVLVGHSLGGIFLAKYCAENLAIRSATAMFLVAAPYATKGDSNEAGEKYDSSDNSWVLPVELSGITDQVSALYICASKDDPVVPFADALQYQAALPRAHTMYFEDRGHFNQEQFPELVAEIQAVSRAG